MIRITEKELLGKRRKETACQENIVRHNALNRTGYLDYNLYGDKDGIGFVPVTEKFVDNFVLAVLVADYHLDEKRKYTEVGAFNKTIRGLLDRSGLKKCDVKATGFRKCEPTETMLQKMPYRMLEKENEATTFYYQEYKVACANIPYNTVLDFLREKEYLYYNLNLRDVDVTQDFAGSFNRAEVVQAMVNCLGFRCEGEHKPGERTILNNKLKVGNNCCLLYTSPSPRD